MKLRRQSRRRSAPAFAVALASLLLIAPPAAAQTASRAEFVAQADPICAAANEKIGALNSRSFRADDLGHHAAAGHLIVKTGVVLGRSVDAVRGIAPPAGDEAVVSDWLALVDRVADLNRRQGKLHAAERSRAEAKLIRRRQGLARRAHSLVADWGFTDCVGE